MYYEQSLMHENLLCMLYTASNSNDSINIRDEVTGVVYKIVNDTINTGEFRVMLGTVILVLRVYTFIGFGVMNHTVYNLLYIMHGKQNL